MRRDEPTSSPNMNPYAPTLESAEAPADLPQEVLIRRKYIGHEMSIQSIGGLFILAALAFFLVALSFEAVQTSNSNASHNFVIVLWSTLATAQLIAAFGLYRLQSWGRWLAIPISVIWLAGVGIGTVLGIYFLFLLLSQKRAYVFTEEYREIRRMTPEVKYQTPTSTIVVVIGLILIIVALVLTTR